jgi:pilus assembly protein CpaC
MQVKALVLKLFALSFIIAGVAFAAPEERAAVPQESTTMNAASQNAVVAEGSKQVELGSATEAGHLRVYAGRSIVVRTPDALKRISVTDDQIAYAVIVSPNQVVIHGLKPGIVTMLLWNENEDMRLFELEVQTDLRSVTDTLSRFFPSENIEVARSGSSLLLRGTVSSQETADRVLNIAKTEASNVVSLLNLPPPAPNQVVLLQVRFAEVDRNAIQELGVNILSTGALNTVARITTGQFSPPSVSSAEGSVGGGSGPSTKPSFQLGDLLNIFVFRPDLNLGLVIRALEQRSLLQILAEPNLLALGGKEASFLAGGEFPVPIVQGGIGVQSVSVQFKEFGVRLKFTAMPQPNGLISLKVAPEVSALDYSNAVTLSGFLIPALTTRRAETEVELRDGQSFAIAGLIDKRLTEVFSKVPWLGDVPFLGKLFQSKSFKHNNSELLVMVTPHLVKPLEPGQAPPGPSFPMPFLDDQKFDGKYGEPKNPGGQKSP